MERTADPVPHRLPDGLDEVRTTRRFTTGDVPAGLLGEHRLARQVWGRIVVEAGSLRLVFDDGSQLAVRVAAGETAVVPPIHPHHVELEPDTTFFIELFRERDQSD